MAEKQKEKKNKKPFKVWFAIFCLMVAAVLVFQTTLLLCACLIPTFVAVVVDTHPQKTAWVTVGCMNFAGAVPSWFHLWQGGDTLTQSLNLLFDVNTYLMAYGAALVGWVLYYNITPFVASMMVMKSEKRLKDIDKKQREMIRKWGTAVAEPESAKTFR